VLGVSAISAPIFGFDQTSTYCVSLAGPTVRVQMHEADFVPQVIRAAADISRQYGGNA